MLKLLLASAALAGLCGAAAAQNSDPAAYLRRPNLEDLRAVWPAGAKLVAAGRVELVCTPGADGTFTACRVDREEPAGAGFGEAALKLAPKFALKPGVPNDGRLLLHFRDPDLDTQPDWKRRPTPAELLRVYPKGALKRGGGGQAVMDCEVAVSGTLRGCRVESEDPRGEGWGEAALALAPQFLMHPPTKDGQPVAGGTVRIPIRWPAPPKGASGGVELVSRPHWSRAPSHAEVAAAYPKKAREARASGDVTLRCQLNSQGRLHGCATGLERPKGLGLALAARELTRHFVGPLQTGEGRSTRGALVDIRFAFDPRMLTDAAPVAGKPDWTRLPAAEDVKWPAAALKAGRSQGQAILSCLVAQGGLLTDCQVAREEPAGLGFGAASLELAGKFAVNPWTDEGLPVVGARVSVPVRFREGPEKGG